MPEAIAAIQRYTDALTQDLFETNRLVVDAVIYNLAIIGEAASHVPSEVQVRYSDIPWATMRGVRNIMVHEYHGVDLAIIWRTLTEDLPPIALRLTDILEPQE